MNKALINKIYIKYSLIAPITYVAMLFFNYTFGTSAADYTSRPLGPISDTITFLISLLYALLSIIQVVLFFMNYEKIDISNTLILILNSILAYLMEAAARFAWIIIGFFMAVGIAFALLLPIALLITLSILGVYIFQIHKFVKILKEENQKNM